MQLRVGVNPKEAYKQLEMLGDKATHELIGRLAEATVRNSQRIAAKTDKYSKSVEKTGRNWKAVGASMLGVAAASATIYAGLSKILQVSEKAARATDMKSGFLNLGGQQQTIEKVNAALGKTVDKMTLLQGLRDAKLTGLSERELQALAQSSAVVAKNLGESKQSIFQLATQANLTEEHFQAVGSSMAQVNQAIAVEEARRQRALTETEQKLVKIRLFIRAASQESRGFTTSTKQAGDKFDQIRVRIDEIILRIGKKLLPHTLKLLQVSENILKWVDKIPLAYQKASSWVKKWGAELAVAGNVVKSMLTAVVPALGNIERAGVAIKKAYDQAALSRIKSKDEIQVALIEKQKRKAEAIYKKQAEAQKAIDKKRQRDFDRKQQKRGWRGVSRAAQERVQEQIGFQIEALNRIRNFSSFALDLASNIGGPVSGVLSALKDHTEQIRIFEAKFGKGFVAQVQGKSIDQLKKMYANDKQRLKASILLNMSRKAGLLDIEEYVINEKIATLQLKAQIAPAQELAGLMQNQVERLNAKKDVQASIKSIQVAEKALQFAKTAQERDALKLTIQKAKAYQGIYRQRMATLKISDRILRANLAASRATQRIALQEKQLSGASQLLELRKQFAELQGKDATLLKIEAVKLQQQQYALDVQKKQVEILKQEQLLRSGKFQMGTAEFALQQAKISGLRLEVEQLNKVAAMHQKIAHAQLNPNISAIATKHGVQFAQQMQQELGQHVANIFEAMFSGDKMEVALAKIGLSIMSALGDTLIAAGTQTFFMGLASLFNPYLGANPAAMGVGAAMIVAGGALKGGSAAIAASMSDSGASTASGAQTRARVSEPSSPAQAQSQGGGQVVNVYNMQDPYFEGNMSSRVGNLQRQLNRYGVSTGVGLNPQMIRGN